MAKLPWCDLYILILGLVEGRNLRVMMPRQENQIHGELLEQFDTEICWKLGGRSAAEGTTDVGSCCNAVGPTRERLRLCLVHHEDD